MVNDTILTVMFLLRNNWNLTGDLAASKITFGTRIYDESITFPQIVVTPSSGLQQMPIDMGSNTATYPKTEVVGINIYIRPMQDSATSIGWAKNAIWKTRKEVERILRTGSYLSYPVTSDGFNSDDFDSDDFEAGSEGSSEPDIYLYNIAWTRRDNLIARPPVYAVFGKTYVTRFVKEV